MEQEVSSPLLRWYDEHKRDLPWRGCQDPYAILLSEIMLQQTTVATVTPRWKRFLKRWPTVAALAAASEDDVVHEWTGLGYYRRARNLHRAAKAVVENHGGDFPQTAETLKTLPGVGDYTAAAVASIAFHDPVPVLDANVERVASRLLAMETNARTGAGKKTLKNALSKWIDEKRPGDFNQAIMELGAVICSPKTPDCGACPLQDGCAANKLERQGEFPVLPEKKPFERITEVAVLLQDGEGRVLIVKRPENVSLAGMWELPKVELEESEDFTGAARRAARDLVSLRIRPGALFLEFEHTIMRRRISLKVLRGTMIEGKALTSFHEEARWASLQEWRDLPKSTTQAKIVEMMLPSDSTFLL